MTIPVSALTLLVCTAFTISLATPIIFIYLLFKDWKDKRLW